MKASAKQQVRAGRKGGKTTVRLYGAAHMKALALTRWGRRPKKPAKPAAK